MLAFVLSRVVSGLAVALSYVLFSRSDRPISEWEGWYAYDYQWYRAIGLSGYGPGPVMPVMTGPEFQTRWPFFPLYPWLLRGFDGLGIATETGVLVLSIVATLAAYIGLYLLAEIVLDERRAKVAIFVAALGPFAYAQSMGYPTAIVLAAASWLGWAVLKRQWWIAGASSLVIVAIRPNGFVVPAMVIVALVIESWRSAHTNQRSGDSDAESRSPLTSAWRTLFWPGLVFWAPTGLFMGAWMWFNNDQTGNPLTFWYAKYAWDEVTLVRLVTFDSVRTLPHALVGATFIAVVIVSWRRPKLLAMDAMPLTLVLPMLAYSVPSFLIGVHGVGRYASEMPASLIALAALASLPVFKRGKFGVHKYFVASALACLALATASFTGAFVP